MNLLNSIVLMPCRQSARYLPTVLESLKALRPQPDRYTFLENNSVDNTLQLLIDFNRPKEIIRVWFRDDVSAATGDQYLAMKHVRQLLLTRARQLNPDYAIFLDSDVKVASSSRNLIERLTTPTKYPILGGPYSDAINPLQYCALVTREMAQLPAWFREGDRYFFLPVTKIFKDWPVHEVSATGGGCMSISRKVLQNPNINFYPGLSSMEYAEDFGYCEQARRQGYRTGIDRSIVLTHEHPIMSIIPPEERAWRG